MTTRSWQIDGSGSDGMLITWDSGQLPVSVVHDAFRAANAEAVLPKSATRLYALRVAFSALLNALQIKTRGMPLQMTALHEDLVGFEARRIKKGDTENDPEFVMSVVLHEGDSGVSDVRIAKFSSAIVPQLVVLKPRIEAKLAEIYQEELQYYPSSIISTALQRLVMQLGGISLRQAGGAYFLPSKSMDVFNKVADALEAPGGKLCINTVTFPLKPTERSYRWVLDSLRKEVAESLAEIEEELKDLGGRKQRANGMESRLEHACRIDKKITAYESLLNVTLNDLHEAVTAVKNAVDAHNLMEVCS
jgi:hypothetical protein